MNFFDTINYDDEPLRSCCFTGYRPSKFPFPFEIGNAEYTKFENSLIGAVFELVEQNCLTFYTGMAMGFDIVAAETVLLMKRASKNSNINLVCVLPFLEQSENFPILWKKRYNNILNNADKVITTSDEYYTGCYQKRNRYMVENSDYVMTWFDGKPGGTCNTIKYANSLGRGVINLSDNLSDKKGTFENLNQLSIF